MSSDLCGPFNLTPCNIEEFIRRWVTVEVYLSLIGEPSQLSGTSRASER
jgi:hypothetical protein